MLGLFRKSKGELGQSRNEPARPPAAVQLAGQPGFVLGDHMDVEQGYPYMRWAEVWAWADAFPEAERPAAFEAVADAWDQHVCIALGPKYRVSKTPGAVLISTLEPRQVQAALEFMVKTQRRILRSLDGVALAWEAGSDLLIVVDDDESYYRFISRFYPEGGQYAVSAGVKVDDGAVYYVCRKGHLRDVESVIAHEMTHGFISHLRLPKWLDEGIAVNMEHRLTGVGMPLLSAPEMRAKHQAFWDPTAIQALWTGKSFHLPGEANMLSYDLSRILVEQLSGDWPRFAAFVRDAREGDAGAESARRHLGVTLGVAVAALVGSESPEALEPQPPTSQ
jgi:hypothetical protein